MMMREDSVRVEEGVRSIVIGRDWLGGGGGGNG